MTTTPNLLIDHIAASQAQKEVTAMHDREGQRLAQSRENIRARGANAEGKIDNDF